MADTFDRDRFAYELAQELGLERAKWARGPVAKDAVSEGLQRTAQRGPEGQSPFRSASSAQLSSGLADRSDAADSAALADGPEDDRRA